MYPGRVQLLRGAASLLLVACVARDEAVLVGSVDLPCDAAEYVAHRRALNFCERDQDCVEVVPAPCLASYYANEATAAASLRDHERELAERCAVAPTASCQRPSLRPPRCRRGRCEPGGLDREERRRCWSGRLRVLELGRAALVHTGPDRPPTPETPQLALLRVDEPGRLTLRVEPGACSPYELLVQRPRSSWSSLLPLTTGATTLTTSVTPGEHRIFARGPADPCPLTLTATLERIDGTPVDARYHGLRFDTRCE